MRGFLLTLLCLAAFSLNLRAEDEKQPYGVYLLMEKVKLLPNKQRPDTLHIKGYFSVGKQSKEGNSFVHSGTIEHGALYYTLPADPDDRMVALRVWKKIAKSADSYQIPLLGFCGNDPDQKIWPGRVRKTTEKLRAPDTFPNTATRVAPLNRNSAIAIALQKSADLIPSVATTIGEKNFTFKITPISNTFTTAPIYYMTVESPLGREVSRPMKVTEGTISWSPRMLPTENETYKIRCWALDDLWKSPVFEYEFKVGKDGDKPIPF